MFDHPDRVRARSGVRVSLVALGQAGDVFMGFSTSGRSANVVAACKAAKERGLTVIGFTGSKGRVMDEFCHLLIHVPSDITAFIQQVHIAAGHIVCGIVEDELVARDGNH